MLRDQFADALARLSRPADPDGQDDAIADDSDLFADDLTTLACPIDPVGGKAVAADPKDA